MADFTAADFDVVVYGATFPGLHLARYAADVGLKVCVLEWTGHVGGLTTGGLGKTDVVGGNGLSEQTRWGRCLQFYQQIGASAPYNKTDGSEVFVFRAKEAYAALNAVFLNTPLVTVKILQRLSRVYKDPITKKITKIILQNGDTYTGIPYFADCSYETDLAAFAGVKMRSGSDSAALYAERVQNPDRDGVESHPGLRRAGIFDQGTGRLCDSRGDLYPHRTMLPPPWAPEGAGSHRQQAYGFRYDVSSLPNRIPWPKPDWWTQSDSDWVVDLINNSGGAAGGVFPFGLSLAVTGTTTDGEPGIYTTNRGDMPGIWTNNWSHKTYEQRDAHAKKAAEIHMGACWTAANDPRVPQSRRDAMNKYGLVADQWQTAPDYLGFPGHPPAFYIRDSRSIIGQEFLTTDDLYGSKGPVTQRLWRKPNSIAVGGYSVDLHSRYWGPGSNGTPFLEGSVSYNNPRSYEIPLGACLPDKSQCTNLVVGWGISASTLFRGSFRMEMTSALASQSLGILIGIAAKDNYKDVNDVKYSALRSKLDALSAILRI